MEEIGGLNLYAFVANEPANEFDGVGLSKGGVKGPKPATGIKPSFVTGTETVEELKAMAAAARKAGRLEKAKSLEAWAKVVNRYAKKGQKFGGRAGFALVELILVEAAVTVIVLDIELLVVNIENDLAEVDDIQYQAMLGQIRQQGWCYAMQIEGQIDFHCCDKPFSDYDCRVAFRRQVAQTFAALFFTNFSPEMIELYPQNIEAWTNQYVECNRQACKRSRRSGQ